LPLEVYLNALAPHWFGASHLVVRPPRGLQASSDGQVAPVASPSSGFRPASESHPRPPRSRIATDANALPRFLAPSALPIRRKPPVPGLPRPGLVASSHLPCALTPCSFVELPGVFQPGSLLGFLPSALSSQQVARASRLGFPSCDWLCPVSSCLAFENARPRAPAPPSRGTVAASLQGVVPCYALEARRWISPLATRSLALLGFSLSEALSSRTSDLAFGPLLLLPAPKSWLQVSLALTAVRSPIH